VATERANTVQRFTSRMASTESVVVSEDLHVAGMLKNHRLAQASADVGSGEFRRQLDYKVAWCGCRVAAADRWERSSKTCLCCGWVDEDLTLAYRMFQCQSAGLVIDRDQNAAKHLEKLAGSSSDSQTACGEGSAGGGLRPAVKLRSVKQEPDTRHGLSTFG